MNALPVVLLVLGAAAIGVTGSTHLTRATAGVGIIAGACLVAIIARVVQADVQHTEMMRAATPGARAPSWPRLIGPGLMAAAGVLVTVALGGLVAMALDSSSDLPTGLP
jgi:hypothetical protein